VVVEAGEAEKAKEEQLTKFAAWASTGLYLRTGQPFICTLGAWRREGMSGETRNMSFTNIKVFSTTLARDREMMGENISRWIKENPNVELVDRVVTQSSDKEFHCLTITLFYRMK